MIQSSKIGTFVCHAAKTLKSAFMQSCLYAGLLAVVVFLADSYAHSGLRKALIGSGDLERFAPDSAFYRVFGGFANGVIGFFAGICGAFRKYAEDSALVKLFQYVLGGTYRERYLVLVSFVCVFIFVIPHHFWSNTFGLLFAVLLFALYCIAVSDEKSDFRPGTNFDAVWFSFLMFGCSLLVSCLISYDHADSVRVLLFFITSFMLCLILYASLRRANDFHVIGGFMYAALIFTSVLAFAQRVMGVEADASLTDLTLNQGMPGRVFSTLGNPNNYAEFLVLFLPFAFAFALSHEKGTKRTMLIGGMILPLGAILLTYSRSGWIALAIAAVIFIMLYDKRLIPVFVILFVCALPLIPSTIWNRILTIGNLQDSSSSYRVDIWKGCLAMLKEYWFTGVGLGTGGFAEIYPRYAVGESGVAPHSHMHFMEMLAELGVLGFLSYIGMTFCLIRRSFVASSRKTDAGIRNYAIASAASMTGIVLIGCFEYCWFYPRVMFAFFLCAGIAMAASRRAHAQATADKTAP